jgi:hydroxymethylbilane synthase
LAQAESVARAIEAADDGVETELVPITTSGDRSGLPEDKSRFVKEIEEALLRGEVDLAVHSAKDVPGELPDGLEIVGAPAAEDARDALVGGPGSLGELPEGARVGTSSLRRRSQLLAIRPDLEVTELRGNVDTRLTKLGEGDYDTIVLALAGLRRLGREPEVSAALDAAEFVPAPGQGILALEARSGHSELAGVIEPLIDSASLARLRAERALVRTLDASCRTPVGAHCQVLDGKLLMDAYIGLPDGSEWIRDRVEGDRDPAALGRRLAKRMLNAGAGEILRRAQAAPGPPTPPRV